MPLQIISGEIGDGESLSFRLAGFDRILAAHRIREHRARLFLRLIECVLHTIVVKDDEEMENEADHFAGAFLLPADEIKVQLRRFDLRHLASMKGYWRVSMHAIAHRADRLNLITPYQKKMFWIEIGKIGYRKREPNEPKKEIPGLLRKMITFHQRRLGYSVSDLARLLCLEIAEFQAMYSPEVLDPTPQRPNLRIVV
jgi:hypothetical protein